ncbi:unnamed protein product, partial [Prorocentrum cordatum]
MRDAVQQARQDMHDLRQQNAALQRQADQAGEPEIIRRLGEVLERVTERPPPPAAQLIQAKDTGKPQAFKNEESKFSEWLQKLNSYALSVFGVNSRPAIEWAVDQANDAATLTTAAAMEQFVNEAEDGEAVDNVDEKLSQLYAVFVSLTEGEPFDLVVGAGRGNGAEALRLLARRWDPTSGGRRRVLLKKITAPTRVAKLENLGAEVAKLEELVRRYERRRADGRDAHLDDEIMMSALESLAPQDVEMHLALNRARFQDYAAMREEVRSFLETRQAQGALGRSRGDPMEVDAFVRRGDGKGERGEVKGKDGKGKNGSGKGKTGNSNVICWNCRKKGHRAQDWWKPTERGSKDDKGKGKGYGKDPKGQRFQQQGVRRAYLNNFGGDLNNFEGDTQSAISAQLPTSASQAGVCNQSPAALSFDAFERVLELNSVEAKGEKQRRKCIAMTFDTGAAATAFPLEQEGECAEDEGGVGIRGVSEHGESMFLKGRRANIGKPLLSASATTAKGHFTWVGAFGGRILKESEFAQEIHQRIDQCVAEGNEGIAPLYLQNGVYKMDVLMPAEVREGIGNDEDYDGNPQGVAPAKVQGRSDCLLELKLTSARLQVTLYFELGVKFVVQLEGLANLMNYKLKFGKETGEGDEGQEDNFPMLVARDSKTKLPYSTAILGKKVTNFMIKIPMSFILHLGYRRLIFQSDGEPAIAALKTAVAVATPTVEFLPREPPAGERQSNGGIEVTVREVKRHGRANRYALEAKLGRKVDDDHPILKWLPQYAAACIGRHRRGTDGLTGEQRRSGRDWKELEAEFGERVVYRPLAPGGRRSTMEERVKSGNFLGYYMMRTGALLVMMVDGVEKAQGFKKLPKEQAWDSKDGAALRGVPWATRLEEEAPSLARAPVVATVRMEPRAPRARCVLRRDIEKYGATAGCPGCFELTQKGRITKSHSDECRDRIAVFEVEKQLEETKLPYRRPLETATELLPQSRGTPRWRWCWPEAAEANRALPGCAEETHPTLDELPGHEEEAQMNVEDLVDTAMSQAASSSSASASVSRPSQAPDGSMGVDFLERTNGYDKGRTFIMTYELAMFEVRANANVNDAEQAEEIAPLLTKMCAVDTAEVYSPRRFAEMTFRHGLAHGLAVDVETGWDLRLPEQRKECKKQLKDENPLLTITRPPCTSLSNLRTLSDSKRDPKIVEAEILEGEAHLNFSMEICKERYKAGKLFLHEAPWSASSWHRPSVQEVMQLAGVSLVHGPMCRWHMQATDSNGKLGFVRKETGWLTNSELLAEILKGPHPHEEDTVVFAGYQDDYFIDDLTGEILDPEGVRAARQEELDWRRGRQVWMKVPRREMLEKGKKAVTLKWIDTNKGDRTQPRYRKGIKKAMRSEDRPDQAELFSAMPPLEAFRAMVAIFVGRVNDAYHDGDTEQIIYKFYDISRAHFYGDVNREVYVELPEEETHDDPEPMVGRLLKTMHGTVDASHVWQDDYIGLASSHGFKEGVSNPALLYHAERHIQAEVHGDDFGVMMRKSQEGWFDDVLSRYDFKVTGILSSRPLEEQSVVYLDRVSIWNPFERSAYLEADARHVKMVIRDLGLENAMEVATPAAKRSVAEILSGNQTSPKLDDEKVKTYRSVTMRMMCLSLDRPDISYSASMQARHMKEPKETHVEDLKRIGRDLKKYPAGRLLFPAQKLPRKVCVYCDSDYAGDPIT